MLKRKRVNNITSSDKNLCKVPETFNDRNKVTRKTYSFKEKLNILQMLEVMPTGSVCKKFNISKSVICKWRRNKLQIEVMNEKNYTKNLKKNRRILNPEMEEKLYSWYLQARDKGIYITGQILQKEALKISKEYGDCSFKASEGWLDRWKRRKNIKLNNLDEQKAAPENNLNNNTLQSNFLKISKNCQLTERPSNPCRKHYSFQEKMKILRKLKTMSIESICEKCNISRSVLNKWKTKQVEIKQLSNKKYTRNLEKNRKTMNSNIEDKLYSWYLQSKKKGSPVSKLFLQKQALKIGKEMGDLLFKDSDSWLAKWKNIQFDGIHELSENISIDEDIYLHQEPKILDNQNSENVNSLEKCDNYNKENILNLSESIKILNSLQRCENLLNKDCLTSCKNLDMLKNISIAFELYADVLKQSSDCDIRITDITTSKDITLPLKSKDIDIENDSGTCKNFNSEKKSKYCDIKNVTANLLRDNEENSHIKNNKRRTYSFQEKLHILKQLEIMSADEVSQEYNISKSVLCKWKRRRLEIQEMNEKSYTKGLKKNRCGLNPDLENSLYLWYLQARNNGIPISGPILQRQALQISKQLGSFSFKASDGWLIRWKKRKNIQLNNYDESPSHIISKNIDNNNVNNHNYNTNSTKKILEDFGFSKEQISKFDESGLSIKVVPGS